MIEAMLGGKITPAEGSAVLGALAAQSRLAEFDYLIRQIDVLERAQERR